MLKKLFKAVDFGTLAVVLFLFLIGITALYSANGGAGGDISEVWKQVLWFSIGTVFVVMLRYRVLMLRLRFLRLMLNMLRFMSVMNHGVLQLIWLMLSVRLP